MALSQNQLDTLFKSSIGRDTTKYEATAYGGKSLADLSNLKSDFSSLRPNDNISDYLKYNGRDNSSQGISELAKQYGVNYDQSSPTTESNRAILDAVKGGTFSQPVQGSVNGASQEVSTALGSAQKQYTESQSAVQKIDDEISGLKKKYLDEAAKSGAILTESDVDSLVARDRQDLMLKRLSSARIQSTAGQQLRQEQQNHNQQVQEKYKSDSLTQKGRLADAQLTLSANKADTQQNQFDIKTGIGVAEFNQKEQDKAVAAALKAAGVDASQWTHRVVSDTDPVTHEVLGSHVEYFKKTPDQQSGIGGSIRSATTPIKKQELPSGQSIETSSSLATSPNYLTNGGKGSFVSNQDAPTDDNSSMYIKGLKDGKVTVQALYDDALLQMGGNYKSFSRGSKRFQVDYDVAIKNKAAQLLKAFNSNPNQYLALSKAKDTALRDQMKRYGVLLVNEGSARKNFDLLVQLGKKANVKTTDIPNLDGWIATGKIEFEKGGNPDLNNYRAQLTIALNEYAKVVTGQTTGAAVSDSARGEVARILSIGQSQETLESLVENVIKNDLDYRESSSKEAMNSINDRGYGTGAYDKKPSGALKDAGAPTTVDLSDPAKYNFSL